MGEAECVPSPSPSFLCTISCPRPWHLDMRGASCVARASAWGPTFLPRSPGSCVLTRAAGSSGVGVAGSGGTSPHFNTGRVPETVSFGGAVACQGDRALTPVLNRVVFFPPVRGSFGVFRTSPVQKMADDGKIFEEGADLAETASRLATNFSLSDEVVQALIDTKMQNLEEFRFYFEDITKIELWLSRLQLGESKALQVARLRRAWRAGSLYGGISRPGSFVGGQRAEGGQDRGVEALSPALSP